MFHAFKPLFLIPGLLLMMSACATKQDETALELSEESASAEINKMKKLPLSATFLSESGELAYTLHYEGMKYKLISNPLREGSEFGANMMAEGGIEISSRTFVNGALPSEWNEAPMKKIAGRTFGFGETQEDQCQLAYAYTPQKNEYLVFEAKSCEGDAPLAKEALEELLEGLTF